ncbi:hypothetical protein I4U23_021041 [Adineta vaga]|nr:hypothetical protein I4U23_021041 [Adineta vaga]
MHHARYRWYSLGVILCIVIIIGVNFRQTQNQIVEIDKPTSSSSSSSSCNISMTESDQFICESDKKWLERRKFYLNQHEENIFTMNEYENYFRKNWFPDFQCSNEKLIGQGDGGKWACNIERLKSKSSCLIYSMGSQGDFSFERHAHELLPHCSIHTVDMRLYECPKEYCTFHQARLGDGQNGSISLRQLMTQLNQTNSEIDILKIDIEYGEYSFLHSFFSNNDINRKLQPVYIRQILIEIHLDRTRILETNSLFHLLNSQNYVLFHKELNPGFPYYACEYALLKLNRAFFRGYS